MKRVNLTDRPADQSLSLEEYESGLLIDEHALDEALVRQPDMFYRVSKRLAMLTSQRDAKKQEVSELEASADAETREVAGKHKDKVTEAEVKNMVRLDPGVQRAMRELLEFNRKVGAFTALKEAFQQRSYVLKDLVNLHISNYYGNADGTPTGATRKFREHTASRVRDELRTRRQGYERE